jgi:hypothetical protein
MKSENTLGQVFYMCVASTDAAEPSPEGREAAKDDTTPKYQMWKKTNRIGDLTQVIFENKICVEKCRTGQVGAMPKMVGPGPHDRNSDGEIILGKPVQ